MALVHAMRLHKSEHQLFCQAWRALLMGWMQPACAAPAAWTNPAAVAAHVSLVCRHLTKACIQEEIDAAVHPPAGPDSCQFLPGL